MKKILFTGLAILFLGLSANAQTAINYYGGRPVSMTTYSPGYMRTVPIVNGNTINPITRTYARPYSSGIYNRQRIGVYPRRPARPAMPYGYRGYYNNYYNQPTVVTTTKAETKKMSRLNKDYKRPQRSSYIRNGVTYYN